MAWIDKILYARALWYIFVGFIAICIGLSAFFDKNPTSINDLQKKEGHVIDIRYQNLSSHRTEWNPYCMIVFLNTNDSAYIPYNAKIQNTSIKKGDFCIVWTEKQPLGNQENKIRELTINGEKVVKFKREYWPFIIIGIGLFWFIIPLLVVVKRSDILFGKKKSEEDGENKKSIKEILKDCLQQLKIW